MTSAEIRQSFLDFFNQGYTIVPSASLPDSPNLLFTNAGMNHLSHFLTN
jgi:alanyl-tRNA synthetase